jgi:hypothetical protein
MVRLLAFGGAGVSQRSGSRVHEQWARFRFSVIGQLLAVPPRKGVLRLRRLYRGLDAKGARDIRHYLRVGMHTIVIVLLFANF